MVGDTPNIRCAAPELGGAGGGSRAAASTRRLLGDLFTFRATSDAARSRVSANPSRSGRSQVRLHREPLRGGAQRALDCLCRPQGRGRSSRARASFWRGRPRPGGVDFRRGRDRQIAPLWQRPRALRQGRTAGCGISARRTTRTVRFIPFIAQLERAAGIGLAGHASGKSSTSLRQCSRLERSRWRQRRRSLPRFFRSQPASAIRRSP